MSGELIYGTNPGCVASSLSSAGGGTPGQCGQSEAWAVPHRYRYPKPHLVRLYACEHHGRDMDGAEPLTDDDRRTIADRHERQRQQMPRRGAGHAR